MVHIFVINQYAGNQNFEDELLKKIEKIENLEYYVFNTRNAGDEKNVVKQALQIFEGEKLRFYCCGGSGTIRNVLNGFDNLEDVEIAFIPYGMTNDFLKVFPEQEKLFKDPMNLIHGKVIKIDYIKTNHGISLNTFSWGWDSNFVKGLEEMRIFHVFGEKIPVILALLYAGTHAKSRKMEISLDGKKIQNRFTQFIFGNGITLGGFVNFAVNSEINDGKASFCVIPHIKGLRMIRTFIRLMKNDMEYLRKNNVPIGTCSHMHIKSLDGTPLEMNFDGELEEGLTEWDIHIIPKGLNFVVPKEVQGYE